MGSNLGKARKLSKSVNRSAEDLGKKCTQQHMAMLLDMSKQINAEKTFDGAVHRAIGG